MALKGKKASSGFNYQRREKDTLKQRANMRGGGFDTIFKQAYKQWKPKDGKNLIRILPREGGEHYGLDIYVNYNIGADNQSYLSLSKHNQGEDPLAEARRIAMKDGDKDLAKALNPTQRILYWIIDRNEEDEGPLLWASPFTFDKSLANLCIDEDTKEILYIDDPEEGHDVRFFKEGTGLKTNYDPSKMKILGKSPISEDEALQEEWLTYVAENPLEETLNFYTYDHIKMAFDGQAGRRDEDEADEKPARSRSRIADDEEDEKPARGRKREEPEDDDDDEPPARSARTRAGRGADTDDEDRPVRRKRAVDEDDDAEEEKPARSNRTRGRIAEPADTDDGDDDEADEPPMKSRRGKSDDDDEEAGGSLRERLARRRSRG